MLSEFTLCYVVACLGGVAEIDSASCEGLCHSRLLVRLSYLFTML